MKTLLSFFRIRLSCPGLSGIGILRVRNPGIRFYGGCCSRILGRFFPARLQRLGIVPSRRACIDCCGNFCLRLADVFDFFSRGFREAERLPCGLEAKLEIQEPCCGIFGHSRNRRLPCPAVEA